MLPDALRERGAEVDVLALYETVAEPLDDATREAAAAADYVLVHLRLVGALLPRRRRGTLDGPRLVSIGPATSAELRAPGVEPDLEADPHTPDGLVDALLADADARRDDAPDHLPLRLRAGRRVRRRRARRDRADRARRARHRPHATGSRARRARRAR